MGEFWYRAATLDGETLTGVLAARSEQEVRQHLETEGLVLLSTGERSGWYQFRGGGRPSNKNLLTLTRELGSLIRAGMPIAEAIEALIEEERADSGSSRRQSQSGSLLRRILREVREGQTLSGALENRRGSFPELYIHTVRAGERSGQLGASLMRLAEHLQQVEELRQKVVGSLLYPAVLTAVSLGVLAFLGGYVVPSFALILEDTHARLPWATQVVLAASDFLRSYGGLLAVSLVFLALGAAAYRRTAGGHLRTDGWLLATPVIGRVIRQQATIVFCRNLKTLLEGGIPLVGALDISTASVSNRALSAALSAASDTVRQGGALHTGLLGVPDFPRKAARMIHVAEKSGELDEMLSHVASLYESEVNSRLLAFTKLLEPVLMLLMGTAVAFILVAMFLPILELAGTL